MRHGWESTAGAAKGPADVQAAPAQLRSDYQAGTDLACYGPCNIARGWQLAHFLLQDCVNERAGMISYLM